MEGRSSQDYIRSVVEGELAWMKRCARPRYPNPVYRRRFFRYKKVPPEHHIKNLEDLLQIIQHLTPRQMSTVNNHPVLLQHGFQLRNLFVHSTTMEVVCMTDWGQASVLPLFLQAGFPPPVSSMVEYYSQVTRITNLAHTMALHDRYTP